MMFWRRFEQICFRYRKMLVLDRPHFPCVSNTADISTETLLPFIGLLVMLNHMVIARSNAFATFGQTSARKYCSAPG